MTAQISDSLIFEGRRFSLSCEPLITSLWRRKITALQFRMSNTACSRGFSSTWEIQRGRLYPTLTMSRHDVYLSSARTLAARTRRGRLRRRNLEARSTGRTRASPRPGIRQGETLWQRQAIVHGLLPMQPYRTHEIVLPTPILRRGVCLGCSCPTPTIK